MPPISDIPIYVINMDRSPERLEYMRRQLAEKQLSLIRISAVDANSLGEPPAAGIFDAERARRAYYAPILKTEIACFMSHRLAWRTFVEESAAPLCITLEDDAELSDAFVPVVEAVAARGPCDWDIIKLFARREQASKTVAELPAGHRLVRHLRQPTGNVGQILSRAGAEKMLARSRRIYRPLDVQLQHWWEFGVRVLSIDPPLVREVSGRLGGTTIGTTRPRPPVDRIVREWRRLIFRSGLLVKSVYHRARQR